MVYVFRLLPVLHRCIKKEVLLYISVNETKEEFYNSIPAKPAMLKLRRLNESGGEAGVHIFSFEATSPLRTSSASETPRVRLLKARSRLVAFHHEKVSNSIVRQ